MYSTVNSKTLECHADDIGRKSSSSTGNKDVHCHQAAIDDGTFGFDPSALPAPVLQSWPDRSCIHPRFSPF